MLWLATNSICGCKSQEKCNGPTHVFGSCVLSSRPSAERGNLADRARHRLRTLMPGDSSTAAKSKRRNVSSLIASYEGESIRTRVPVLLSRQELQHSSTIDEEPSVQKVESEESSVQGKEAKMSWSARMARVYIYIYIYCRVQLIKSHLWCHFGAQWKPWSRGPKEPE